MILNVDWFASSLYTYLRFIYMVRYLKIIQMNKSLDRSEREFLSDLRIKYKNINNIKYRYSLPFYIKHARPSKAKLKSLEEDVYILLYPPKKWKKKPNLS